MNPRHSYAYLDGVRGWAALMVAYSHFVAAMHPALLGAGAERAHFAGEDWFGSTGLILLYNPQLAVDVFFVLSGFVLSTSVNGRPAPFVELAVRRWVRLGLPILGSTALIWPLVNWHLFSPDTAGPLAKSDWLLLCYNWTSWPVYPEMDLQRLFWQSLVSVFMTGEHWYNPALWTMKMEFWGSLGLFAGYCLLPAGLARRGGGLLAALIAIGFVWDVPLLGPFAYGIALFEATRLLRQQPQARRAALARLAAPAAIVLLVAGALLGGMPYDMGSGLYRRIYVVLAPYFGTAPLVSFRLAALCVVTAVLAWAPLQRLLLTPLSQWLGRVSFMLYLVHVPILCSLGAWLLLRLEPLVGYNPATLLVLPLFLGAALTVAGLATRWIDEPAIRLSRRVGAAVVPALLLAVRRALPGALPQARQVKAEP